MPEVLAVERDLEAERVVVVEHPAAAVGEDPALGRAAAERPDDLLDVEAGLDRQDDALGDAEVGAGQDDLVDRLDRLAGADRPDVGDRPAHRASRTGRACSTSAASPPTKIVSVALRAPSLPPETGASTIRRPRSARRAAKSQLPDGAIVEQSMTSVPGPRARRRRRPGPNRTASTSGRVRDADDHDVDVGDRLGRGVGHRDAEVGELGARPGVRFQPVTVNPARARLAAIAAPIVPRPRKATRPRSGRRLRGHDRAVGSSGWRDRRGGFRVASSLRRRHPWRPRRQPSRRWHQRHRRPRHLRDRSPLGSRRGGGNSSVESGRARSGRRRSRAMIAIRMMIQRRLPSSDRRLSGTGAALGAGVGDGVGLGARRRHGDRASPRPGPRSSGCPS